MQLPITHRIHSEAAQAEADLQEEIREIKALLPGLLIEVQAALGSCASTQEDDAKSMAALKDLLLRDDFPTDYGPENVVLTAMWVRERSHLDLDQDLPRLVAPTRFPAAYRSAKQWRKEWSDESWTNEDDDTLRKEYRGRCRVLKLDRVAEEEVEA